MQLREVPQVFLDGGGAVCGEGRGNGGAISSVGQGRAKQDEDAVSVSEIIIIHQYGGKGKMQFREGSEGKR